MSETNSFDVSGIFRPCPECHYPSMVMVNGSFQSAPGGTRLEWSDDRTTRYITPHSEGCTVAAEPNHPDGKWLTLPPAVVSTQSVEVMGIRIVGDQ